MIMQPAVLALTVGSLLVGLMTFYAAYYGVKILRYWDLRSGSDVQLSLERKTYLISTVMTYTFLFQAFSLFLFIFTADALSSLFVGAMCAAGTLNVNSFGYPTMLLKIVNFVVAGTWLTMNYTDNRAVDYPLIKRKYLFLLLIAPLILTESVTQSLYFLNLKAHVITSCCGSLFSPDGAGVGAGITALPSMPGKVLFYSVMVITWALGICFYLRKGYIAGTLFACFGIIAFVVSIVALISFISLYFYELPTHHCPFCILQKEYLYVGYPLYLSLLGGAVSCAGVGILMPARNTPSLKEAVPRIQRKLTLVALFSYLVFTLISTWAIVFSDFRLEGY
jgi:hypothetical protein